MFTGTTIQAASYLLGVCLFSIAFLVFLNSSVSFVVTDLLKQEHGVGNAVGTLGFADELVALIACPAWGIISDRIGVRAVCVIGYAIIGLALFLFVQAHNVFPQLLLARLFFSIGGAASSTMVTAMLPAMITPHKSRDSSLAARTATSTNGHTLSPSISSELTITPSRHHQQTAQRSSNSPSPLPAPAPTRLAGFVGLFTGSGALVALVLFLPLPANFRNRGIDAGDAVKYSYYIVGAVALTVAVLVFFGLRNIPAEEGKGFANLRKAKDTDNDESSTVKKLSYGRMLLCALRLGFTSTTLSLGYAGGFVARASSVGISLFIPLFVNGWFISSGMCERLPDQSEAVSLPMSDHCGRAYVVAAELTGVSQSVALVFAPIFGYLADRYPRFNAPLLLAALVGIVGYLSLANLDSPDPKAVGGSPWVFFVMALLGISQIGAIVCSLGLLGRSVLEADPVTQASDGETTTPGTMLEPNNASGNESGQSTNNVHISSQVTENASDAHETSALLTGRFAQDPSRQHLKGSIAGVYSLAGAAGILLLTKLGGYLFDRVSPSAPFYMLASFNGLLLLLGLLCGILKERLRD